MVDYLGGLLGAAMGAGFSFGNPKTIIQTTAQGLSGGTGAVAQTVNLGLGGAVGMASLGLPGLKQGVTQGLGAVPSMAAQSANNIVKAVEFPVELLVVGGVLVLIMLSGGNKT